MTLVNIKVPLYDDNCSERGDMELTINAKGNRLIVLTLRKGGYILAEVDCLFQDLQRAYEAVKHE